MGQNIKEIRRTGQSFLLFLVLISLFLKLVVSNPIVPYDGMVIEKDTTFVKGVYNFKKGVTIGSSGITLDLGGSSLVGHNFTGYGIKSLHNNKFTIKNGVIKNYFYAIFIRFATGIKIIDNDVSNNYVDPNSKTENPPWLDIFVSPEQVTNDTTNFGGGLFLENVTHSLIHNNKMLNQENGLDCFYCDNNEISNNFASDNMGWGIHLWQSNHNLIKDNIADNVIRKGDGDTSALLLACSSSYNTIISNSFKYSGDGVYLTWTPSQPKPVCCSNNYNVFLDNDASYASANAFESDFSIGCQFINNNASHSRFGFWLGYSRLGTVLRGNTIAYNEWAGIAIEHGQDFIFEQNIISHNGWGRQKSVSSKERKLLSRKRNAYPAPWEQSGIELWSNGEYHYPVTEFTCLDYPNYDQTKSKNYTIINNVFLNNTLIGLRFENNTDSFILNNAFYDGNPVSNKVGDYSNTVWSQKPTKGPNIIGGPMKGGNYYKNYLGCDKDGDGIGDTMIPYDNNGLIDGGDYFPLTNRRC